MQSHFSQQFFIQNRARLRQEVGNDYPIIIAGNGLLQRSNDTTFPFQQQSDFWYLTGIDEPDAVLCMLGAQEFLIIPERNAVRSFFDGAVETGELTARSGIKTVLPETTGWENIRASVAGTEVITHAQTEVYDALHGIYANPAQRRLASHLKRVTGKKLIDIQPYMASLRVIKQPEELRTLETAVSITYETLDAVRQASNLRQFVAEHELEAAISAGFRQAGASGHGYAPIVAGGPRATTLHYVANNSPLRSDELIVVDVGAEVEHYSADITRTLLANEPSRRQRDVLAEVQQLQAFAIGLLKPGAQMREYEQTVHREMGKALQRLGLVTDPTDSKQIWQYYPHATSHFLGLDVHDIGDYTKPLAAGMVLTCEPGIYIPEEGIGVRLEDDFVITDTGSSKLGGDCSHDAYTL